MMQHVSNILWIFKDNVDIQIKTPGWVGLQGTSSTSSWGLIIRIHKLDIEMGICNSSNPKQEQGQRSSFQKLTGQVDWHNHK